MLKILDDARCQNSERLLGFNYFRKTLRLRFSIILPFEYFLFASSKGEFRTMTMLTLPLPCIFESCIEIKIKLNFYFHTCLWCLKKFYKGLKDLLPELGRELLSI